MGRKIIEDDPDLLSLGIMDIGKLAHALGKVACRAVFGDFDFAPGAVRVEEDEQVDRAIAPILAVVAFELPGAAGIGWRASPISWVGLSSKHTTGRLGSGASA